MKKEIRVVNKDKKIIQVTTVDERWYIKEGEDATTGLPAHVYAPSVTWIADSYPKGIGYFKWLANKGWDEAEAIKVAAGDKGSKVHQAIDDLINGKEVTISSKYKNKKNEEEELTLEEYDCILSFIDWYKEFKPEMIMNEFVIWNDKYNYAGTVDLLCKINSDLYLVDFKTSQYIWPSHELQISAYKQSVDGNPKLAILQLGYKRNKKQYKFTEIEDKFDLFLAARKIWESENNNKQPKQKDYPLSVKL